MMLSTDFGSCLRLFSLGICTNGRLPNIHRYFKFDERPLQISFGLSFRHGTLFIRKQAVFAASAQNFFHKPLSISIHLTRSMIVRLIRSATPFCSPEYGQLFWWMMPLLTKNVANSLLRYSRLLSVRRVLILAVHWFSTIFLNLINLGKTALLDLI